MLASQRTRDVATLLVATGAIGAFLGAVWRPAWGDAIEPAQVLAGLVTYPPDNPVYIHAVRTWTVLHQIPALLLWAGVQERTLALALSGLFGMLSMQALGAVVFALGRDLRLAILAPCVILVSDTASGGLTYFTNLLGNLSYSQFGMSFLVLAAALTVTPGARFGALLLGFAPAVHPVIGTWGVVAFLIAAAIDRRAGPLVAREGWRWFAAGLFLACASATIHLLGPGAAPIGLYAAGITEHWDEQRQRFDVLSSTALFTYGCVAFPVFWLWRYPHDAGERGGLLLHALAISGVLGLLFSTSYWIVPPLQPNVIPSLMPSRMLNVNIMTGAAVVIGLSARYRSSLRVQSALWILATVFVVLAAWLAPTDNEDKPRQLVGRIGIGLFAMVLVAEAEGQRAGRTARGASDLAASRFRWLTAATAAAVVAGLAAVSSLESRERMASFVDRTNDPMLALIASRPGLLLTASSMHGIQRLTRRPVVVDGFALDALIYVPDAVPATATILRGLYGVDWSDLLRKQMSFLPDDTGRTLWESRSPGEWQQLAREFHFTDILTSVDWSLKLPKVGADESLALYTVP